MEDGTITFECPVDGVLDVSNVYYETAGDLHETFRVTVHNGCIVLRQDDDLSEVEESWYVCALCNRRVIVTPFDAPQEFM